jgi:hypothetical protein
VLSPAVRAKAIGGIRADSSGYHAPAPKGPIGTELTHIMTRAVGDGTRDALLFAAAVVLVGLCVSFVLPKAQRHEAPHETEAETFAEWLPIDPEDDTAPGTVLPAH